VGRPKSKRTSRYWELASRGKEKIRRPTSPRGEQVGYGRRDISPSEKTASFRKLRVLEVTWDLAFEVDRAYPGVLPANTTYYGKEVNGDISEKRHHDVCGEHCRFSLGKTKMKTHPVLGMKNKKPAKTYGGKKAKRAEVGGNQKGGPS